MSGKFSTRHPSARREEAVDTYFGMKIPDPYRWMEDLESPELHEWVKNENNLSISFMKELQTRSWIKDQLGDLSRYSRQSVPQFSADGTTFFKRYDYTQDQAVLYIQWSPASTPQILLDPNKLSPDFPNVLGAYTPSPDGKYVACQLSSGGSDWKTIRVINVDTGDALEDSLTHVRFSLIAWTKDCAGFFYTRVPAPAEKRDEKIQGGNQGLYYHRLGTRVDEDTSIFKVKGGQPWAVRGWLEQQGQYLFLYLIKGSTGSNFLFYIDLKDPLNPDIGAPIYSVCEEDDIAVSPLGVLDGILYLQTTLNAPNGRIATVNLNDPDSSNWRTLIQEGRSVIAGAGVIEDRLVIVSQRDAHDQLAIFGTDGKLVHNIKLPMLGSLFGMSIGPGPKSICYGFSSFLYPPTVFRLDIDSGETTVCFKPNIEVHESEYKVDQVFYPSKDGTKVPMFIVSASDYKPDGSTPVLLHGYGSNGITMSPFFDSTILVWLKMGGIYAVPNVRGGGVHGDMWHRAGMLQNKQNSFDDFASAAEYLIKHGYTSTRRIAADGYSNGGLLVAATMVQHPGLFGAAFIGHGLLDMLRYQKFPNGVFQVPEFGESSDTLAFQSLYKYAPLVNLKHGERYPPTLVTTSWDDDRVFPGHSFKFAAALKHNQGSDNPVLLTVVNRGSHTYMPTNSLLERNADRLAFEAHSLGMGIDKSPRQETICAY